jgi:hypothetical protein
MEVAVALWEARQYKHHRCSTHQMLCRDHSRYRKGCRRLGLLDCHRSNLCETRGLAWTLWRQVELV